MSRILSPCLYAERRYESWAERQLEQDMSESGSQSQTAAMSFLWQVKVKKELKALMKVKEETGVMSSGVLITGSIDGETGYYVVTLKYHWEMVIAVMK